MTNQEIVQENICRFIKYKKVFDVFVSHAKFIMTANAKIEIQNLIEKILYKRRVDPGGAIPRRDSGRSSAVRSSEFATLFFVKP